MYCCSCKISQNDIHPSSGYALYYTIYYTFNIISNDKCSQNNCFLSSRKDIWCVVAFNSVLIYFGSYLPYLVSRLPIISGFLLYWPNPLFCSHWPNSHCIIIHAVFLIYPAFIYTIKEDSSSAVLKDISINIFYILVRGMPYTILYITLSI
jgi:hypothetical protein